MNTIILNNGHVYNVLCPEDFIKIIRTELGDDAAEYIQDSIKFNNEHDVDSCNSYIQDAIIEAENAIRHMEDALNALNNQLKRV